METFTIAVAQDVLDDLSARLDRTRWIDTLGDDAWKYGLSVPYMRDSRHTGDQVSIGVRRNAR